jgi:hypothetical protein
MSWVAAKGPIRDDDGRVRIVAHHGTVLAQVGGGLSSWQSAEARRLDNVCLSFRRGDDGVVYVQSPG